MTDKPQGDVFDRLMQQIHERASQLPPGSYTTKLITGGVPVMGAKVEEETGELIDAAAQLSALLETSPTSPETVAAREHVIYEAGDVLYHVWVLLGSYGITVSDLRSELERREGTSGLEEKRRRTQS